jgi:ABC-type polysaccharide transport system, permease component
MGFEKYDFSKGILGSEWVGLYHIKRFISDVYAFRLFKNTLLLGFYSIIFGFPAPIILALSFNEVKNQYFKKVGQTISYLPYFISTVIIIGIMKNMLAVDAGKINNIIEAFGGQGISFFTSPEWFRTIYIVSGIWQTAGYSSILYLAALSGIDPELYESAYMDGASRLQKIFYISLPSIKSTITVMFILAIGGILGNDYTKILLIYSPITYDTSDVVSTYVYRLGIQGGQVDYTTAIGMLLNVISFVFLIASNWVTRKLDETSLW